MCRQFASRSASERRERPGQALDRESLSFAVDSRACPSGRWRSAATTTASLATLLRAVQARTGLDGDAAGPVAAHGRRARRSGPPWTPTAARAFESRFGEHAAEAPGGARRGVGPRGLRAPPAQRVAAPARFALRDRRGDGTIDAREVRPKAALALEVDPVLVTALLQKHDPRHAKGDLRFDLAGDRMVIGRSPGRPSASRPQVALQPPSLVRGERLASWTSARGRRWWGAAVSSAPLDDSTVVRIGPHSLRVTDGEVVFGEQLQRAVGAGLRRQIGAVSLLDDVSFTVFTGEVVALVGPSGAGKTTLLNAISGIAPADSGEVLLDGRDFHQLLQVDRSLVGIVPQDDLVNPELKVEESLFYSGRLRFPRDVTASEVRKEVDRVLGELDIEHIRESRIGDALRRGISGGQRAGEPRAGALTRTTRMLPSMSRRAARPRALPGHRPPGAAAGGSAAVFLVTHDLTPEVAAGSTTCWSSPRAGASRGSAPGGWLPLLGNPTPSSTARTTRPSSGAPASGRPTSGVVHTPSTCRARGRQPGARAARGLRRSRWPSCSRWWPATR